MGNNKKTVKCSFCKRLGHNSVTCTVYKEEVDKLRTEFGSNHPDVVEYDSFKSNYSRKSSINANKRRACSYCGEEGHNVRTCAEKRRAISKLKKINSKIPKKTIENSIEKKATRFLILDNITDTKNFGAIVRSAECLGIDGVIISKTGSSPINGDTI